MINTMKSPQYGIDAPGLLRFFFGAGAITLAILSVVLLTSLLGSGLKVLIGLLFGVATFYLLGMGCLMIYYSKVAKLKDSENLLNLVQWSGDELVLDMGCGRGLMLAWAAKRLSTGKAIGIDIWQQEDQANNSAAAAIENAAIAGVAERVEIQTADMRQMPFDDNSFDIVVSSWAVHNLESELDRQKTLAEIIRVLKPGGIVLLSDIEYQADYASYLGMHGMVDVQLHNNVIRDVLLKAVTFGSFAPSAVTAKKT